MTKDWTPYTSPIGHFSFAYPSDWTLNAPANRAWEAGDRFHQDAWPYADTFLSGDADPIGLWVWEMPKGEGEIESIPGLEAWAQQFCDAVVGAETATCDIFTRAAVPMCLDAGGDSCRAALLVPSVEGQFAFFPDWTSLMFTNAPDLVHVVIVGREEQFSAAARYGGSVALLKQVLAQMGVRPPTVGQVPGS